MDFKTVKPEELCDPTLIGYVTKLMKNEGAFPEISFIDLHGTKFPLFRKKQ